MTKRNSFRYFPTSPEIIRLAVMLYVQFRLSLRNLEDLLHESGIDVSRELRQDWWGGVHVGSGTLQIQTQLPIGFRASACSRPDQSRRSRSHVVPGFSQSSLIIGRDAASRKPKRA